ncbi:hypothetical protein HMPREF0281_02307 [Corynebacterium ammoniagenes DSM 20306]|uniref:Uncharacterized protein n=1 Tax=Corynebacterium ammoniagenes DSM 20306 TaxID=649754 RepID=A0ABN0ABV7_CORAM|nr:hypothetical protein HMPREF0281_02307 [Corynebacterium ammoniagenes DSM 20306]
MVSLGIQSQEYRRIKCRLQENIDQACPREWGRALGNWARSVVDKGRLDS